MGKSITLDGYSLEVGQVNCLFEVAVARFLDHNAPLGRDLGMDSVLQLACDVRMTSNNCTEPTQSAIGATQTRAQVAREAAQQEADDRATALSGAQITPVSDSPVDTVGMSRVESPTLGSVDVSSQEDSVDPYFHPRTLERETLFNMSYQFQLLQQA